MKVILLAGGLGTRLAEETEARPKPMVEIGGRPILWHIMKHYAHHGFNEFVVAAGYKSEAIKRYFIDYHSLAGDVCIRLGRGEVQRDMSQVEDWTVHVVDTGADTMTGGRVRRLENWFGAGTFMLTYGDGVSNVNLQDLLRFHHARGLTATITAVRPPARFGGINFDGDRVSSFTEKAQIGEGWINGGFMVFEPAVFRYLKDDATILESDALETLAAEGQLAAYKHEGFWQCMDTLRDKRQLEHAWHEKRADWKVW
jgi:glucose-1-phosphate cytidylyltransferase